MLDDGEGFDVAAARPRPSPLEGGRGLVLMRALVDRLDFVQDADGRHRVTLEKRLVTDAAAAPAADLTLTGGCRR